MSKTCTAFLQNVKSVNLQTFQYLQRLLLVHGRWNYRRVCKFTLFTFWRNAVQVLLIFYYTFLSGYSGTSNFKICQALASSVVHSLILWGVTCMAAPSMELLG